MVENWIVLQRDCNEFEKKRGKIKAASQGQKQGQTSCGQMGQDGKNLWHKREKQLGIPAEGREGDSLSQPMSIWIEHPMAAKDQNVPRKCPVRRTSM